MDTNSNNYLIEGIRCILEVAIEPLSEYELIQMLNEQGWSLPTNANDSLDLFTSHFLVFNALYQLQVYYWAEDKYLEISALAIQLHSVIKKESSSTDVAHYTSDEALRAYYLDMTQLTNATEDSVNQLLNQFWERLLANDDSDKALAIFSLELPVTYSEIKKRYRSLAMEHHPDRGGDLVKFKEVNWAFGVLQRIYRS